MIQSAFFHRIKANFCSVLLNLYVPLHCLQLAIKQRKRISKKLLTQRFKKNMLIAVRILRREFMRKTHRANWLLFILISLFVISLSAQFPESFEGGIPNTWSTHDLDGNGTSFAANQVDDIAYDGNWAAHTMPNNSGDPSNDWLITPAINITAEQNVIKFYAKSAFDPFIDIFNIMLSTTGNNPNDFTNTIQHIPACPDTWTEYTVDLSDHVGEIVYLGIQCVSTQSIFFYVDAFSWISDQDLIAENIYSTDYIDQSWEDAADGIYIYAIKANYTDGISSRPAFSNELYKNMFCNVTINLATEDGESPAGAQVSLVNSNGDSELIYTEIANSQSVSFPLVFAGIYSLNIFKEGYQAVFVDNIIIAGSAYNHPTITLHPLNIIFAEGFESEVFPPAGWAIIDADDDGYNWELLTSAEQAFSGNNCVASTSYINQIGMLWPNNWLISPQISLQPETNNVMTFWIAPQDPDYNQDHYSILISNTDTNLDSFYEVHSETINFNDWQMRTINLPYAGDNIHIAFRHHDCSDWYWIKIDNIEVSQSISTDHAEPISRKTALYGNYPNPFNPRTNIAFAIEKPELVSIEIYNAKGQKVKTLVNEYLQAGEHITVWDGQDDYGRNVGSGIYFYKMTASHITLTKKLLLLK